MLTPNKYSALYSLPLVVLINGPRSSGKDTLAKLISDAVGGHAQVLRFSDPLKEAVTAMFFDSDFTGVDYNDPEFKSSILDAGAETDYTVRQELMDYSEKWIKPRYGKDFFGRKLAQRIDPSTDGLYLVPDSRFPEEIRAVVDAVGASNMLLLSIHRPDHTFAGESGDYLPEGAYDIPSIDVSNDRNNAPERMLDTICAWLETNGYVKKGDAPTQPASPPTVAKAFVTLPPKAAPTSDVQPPKTVEPLAPHQQPAYTAPKPKDTAMALGASQPAAVNTQQQTPTPAKPPLDTEGEKKPASAPHVDPKKEGSDTPVGGARSTGTTITPPSPTPAAAAPKPAAKK